MRDLSVLVLQNQQSSTLWRSWMFLAWNLILLVWNINFAESPRQAWVLESSVNLTVPLRPPLLSLKDSRCLIYPHLSKNSEISSFLAQSGKPSKNTTTCPWGFSDFFSCCLDILCWMLRVCWLEFRGKSGFRKGFSRQVALFYGAT